MTLFQISLVVVLIVGVLTFIFIPMLVEYLFKQDDDEQY